MKHGSDLDKEMYNRRNFVCPRCAAPKSSRSRTCGACKGRAVRRGSVMYANVQQAMADRGLVGRGQVTYRVKNSSLWDWVEHDDYLKYLDKVNGDDNE